MRIAIGLSAVAGMLASAPLMAVDIPPRVPIEQFASMPILADPELSPDGSIVAATAKVGKGNKLVLLDVLHPSPKPRVFDFGKTPLASLHWAGNQRVLATVMGTTKLMGVTLPMLRLIVIDINTGQSRIADPKSRGIIAGQVLYTDPSGAWALVSSQDGLFEFPSVKRVDLATGLAVVVEKQKTDVWDWFADDQGVVRGGISSDEKSWKLWYRDRAGEPLRSIKGKFERNDDSAVDRVTFGRDNSLGTIITNEKTGRFAVYQYDFAKGEIGKPIFEHPSVDIDSVWSDPQTGEVSGVRYQDDRWRTFWIDPKLKAIQTKLDHALPGVQNDIISKSRDGDSMLIWSGSASDPGTYYVLNRKTNRMAPVMQPYDRIDPATLANVTPVNYVARDGLSIPAYLTLPKGRPAKALPLILLPHGGPFSRDDWAYDPFVQFLANRGYAVLQPEFRGSTGYGKDYVSRGYGEWGRKMQDDLDDGVAWLAQTGQIDPKRVCIFGGSYGGYAALWGAIRNPDRYRCAASMAGVTDIEAQLRDNKKSFSATRYFRAWRTKVQGESKFNLATVSPLAQAGRLTIPVLIAHGEDDSTVSVKQGHDLVTLLEKNHANVTSAFYKEGGHGFDNSDDLGDFLTRLEAFLNKYNPATTSNAP